MALSDRVVVMQRGRILQTGAPEAVYRRPASREVAAFFGTPNLIEATVAACRPDKQEHILTIEGAGGRGECRAGQALQRGDKVLVMVRPEDVALAPAGTMAVNGQLAWPGRVIDGVFRGPRRSLAVATAGQSFNVECPASRAAMVGDAVTLAGRRRQCLGARLIWPVKPAYPVRAFPIGWNRERFHPIGNRSRRRDCARRSSGA
jgi:iron(III) transport system ATP-binding protein